MTARFIVRLLDAADRLLAWQEVYATAKPQDRPAASCPFWPVVPTRFTIEVAGQATKISVHWPDLDVARVQALAEPLDVQVGQEALFTWIEPVWLVGGSRDVPLPPVTVKAPVSVSVPTGGLAAVSPR